VKWSGSAWAEAVGLAAVLLGAACGGGGDASPDAGTGDADGAVPSGPGLAGMLVSAAGAPVAGRDVLACMATTCLFGKSGPDGRFDFAITPPAEVALKTHPELATTPRLAAALEPIRITGDARVDAGTLYTPELPQGATIGPASSDPQTLAAGDGLELTLSRATLTPPLGGFLFDVAARKLPADRLPSYPELAGRTVIAVYALHPFAAKSTSPIGVRSPAALADGTAVDFYAVSEIDGRLSAPAVGHASGGFVRTDPGQGLGFLTYVVLAQR
jgi:hypothetical protein